MGGTTRLSLRNEKVWAPDTKEVGVGETPLKKRSDTRTKIVPKQTESQMDQRTDELECCVAKLLQVWRPAFHAVVECSYWLTRPDAIEFRGGEHTSQPLHLSIRWIAELAFSPLPKRQRAGAIQKLAPSRSTPAIAKRPEVRQSCLLHYPHVSCAGGLNPNGIPPHSPRLRGTSYLGETQRNSPQPQRGCVLNPAQPTQLRWS